MSTADARVIAESGVGQIELERYRFAEELGRGGFGRVVAANDLRLGREVAIKIQRADPNGGNLDAARQRFLRGGRLIAQLQHPNLVQVHAVGWCLDRLVMVMERVKGPTLKEYLKERGQLDWRDAARIMREVCEGIAHAHEQGVVHRDLKPSNVIIDETSGAARITDFDLVKDVGCDMEVSLVGTIVGTPYYVAPEQVRTGSVCADTRSDVFALGVMLYELIAGERPFQGRTKRDVMLKILQEKPTPLDERVEGLPSRLLEVLERALAKDPDDRYADAGAMAEALRAALQRREASSRRLAVKRGSRRKGTGRRARPRHTRGTSSSAPALIVGSLACCLAFLSFVLL